MWGAHEVDGRIAAKNATKICAALRQSVDAKSIYEQYQLTQPNVSDNVTQDRARARAWSLMNILFNNEALRAALLRLYAEAWVTGDAAAGEAIGEERELKKAIEGAIDWSKWQPGDAAAAMLLDPPKAFENLVTSSGSLIRGLDKTGYELIGTALADSIRAGYSPNRAAKLIQDAVGSPARALTIAVTESSRVMNASAINRYREAGIDKAQWMVVFGGGACEKCAQNAGKIIPLGGTYPSGNTQPPAHPHCRCNLRPVVPDYNEMFDESGNLMPVKPGANGVSDIMAPTPQQVMSEAGIEPLMPYEWNPVLKQGAIPFTPEEFAKAKKDVKKIADSPVGIRVGYKSIPSILDDGRLKSVAEIEKNFGGTMEVSRYYRESRISLENGKWGVPTNAPQPIYGYIQTPSRINAPKVSFYGEVTLILKETVKGRTTFTVGDSLNDNLIPIKVVDASKGNVTNQALSSAVQHQEKWDPKNTMYIEAQIHGGVTVDDIAYLKITGDLIVPQDILDALAARGIEVRYE